MINVENLTKVFRSQDLGASGKSARAATAGVVALQDVSLTVAKGELHILMGLSGSGKSTLIRCINRLIEPTSGRIELNGRDVTTLNEQQLRHMRRHEVAMVFQGFGLFPHMTVQDNVAYPLRIRGDAERSIPARVAATLQTVGLEKWAQSMPGTLSGGMRQRVGLARALTTGAETLFMDEPFSALDPLIRRDLQAELLELQAKLQRTIVFVTHDFDEATRLGDRVTVLRHGKVVQSGEPRELIFSPTDDYIADFSRGINVLEHCHAQDIAADGAEAFPDAHIIDRSATLKTVCNHLRTSEAVRVAAAGQVCGVITRADVLRALSEAA